MKIPTTAELDAALREHVETVSFLTDSNEVYDPDEIPEVDDPEGDADTYSENEETA